MTTALVIIAAAATIGTVGVLALATMVLADLTAQAKKLASVAADALEAADRISQEMLAIAREDIATDFTEKPPGYFTHPTQHGVN